MDGIIMGFIMMQIIINAYILTYISDQKEYDEYVGEKKHETK